MKLTVSVNDNKIAQRIEDAIEDGIDAASDMETSGSIKPGVGKQARGVARGKITAAGAIFSGELEGSFVINVIRAGNTWTVRIQNTAEHAAAIEYGAEYEEKGPPVAALIPWVETKMAGFDVPDHELDRMPDAPEIEESASSVQGDVDIFAMASNDVIERAFWLQREIKQEGIDALRFMEAGQQWVEENGPDTIASFISTELKSL